MTSPGSIASSSSALRGPCSLQHYWARSASLYRYVPVREFAQAYRLSAAGEAQERALRSPFRQNSAANSALAWAKHAITGAVPPLLKIALALGGDHTRYRSAEVPAAGPHR